jgi:hypothetical protein
LDRSFGVRLPTRHTPRPRRPEVQSNIVNADLIFEKARSRTAPPPPLPDAAPPAFADDVRCRESPTTANDAFASIHTCPSSLVPASEDAPEESTAAKVQEHAQAVMSITTHPVMDRHDGSTPVYRGVDSNHAPFGRTNGCQPLLRSTRRSELRKKSLRNFPEVMSTPQPQP